MAGQVSEVMCQGDLVSVVSTLRVELAQVKEDLSVVLEENRKLKMMMDKVQQDGGVGRDGGVGDGGWKVVHSKGHTMKLSRKASSTESVPCRNTFSVLQDELQEEGQADEDSQSTGKSLKIVGDSLCRYVGRAVRSKISGNYCFPGVGVKQVEERLEGVVDRDSLVCVIVGGNDIHRRRSEELMNRYREALEKVRKQGGIPVACGILPRLGHNREWISRAIGFNNRMERYCRDNRIEFIDVWDHFYGRGYLFARDGVHLSRKGVSVLAGLIDRAVEGFC